MLNKLQKNHEIIGEVRGMGLFIGVEFIDRGNKLKPNSTDAASIVNAMKNRESC